MDTVRVKAYAKLNLSLDITGTQDGYHMLDSVVTTVDLSDVVTLKKRKRDKLVTVAMHGMGSENIPFDSNNAVRAAQAFIDAYDTCGVDIAVYKNIPMGAGLGGSSADVAGVLNGLKKLFAVADVAGVKRLADSIGSDCGYLLTGGYARLKGRGELVESLGCNRKLNFLLLLPEGNVSTPACYQKYDQINCKRPPASDKVVAALTSGDIVALGSALDNALLPAAYALNNAVGGAVVALKEMAPLGVNMTGSGSGVYALFENDQYVGYALSRYRGKCRALALKSVIPYNGELKWQKKD